jgi:phosphonate dehydrogenase
MKKVVVTNPCFPETLALLRSAAEVDVNPSSEPWPHAEVARRCGDAHAVMAFMTDRIDGAMLARCPELRVIGAALKGYDNIDVQAATEAGVLVTVVPDLLTAPTAELAIGLMLGLGRQLHVADALVRERGFRGWRPTHYGRGIAGETVGIVGFGNVGRAIAQRLSAFECRILAFDRSPRPETCDMPEVEMTSLESLLAQSSYVVLALPLLAGTQHLFDAAMLARMRPGALLVNPARGSLVDEGAVADALDAGSLDGYAADVFECEDWARADRPREIEPRLRAPDARTFLTPHLGSAVENVRREIELTAARCILQALAGDVPEFAINASPLRAMSR